MLPAIQSQRPIYKAWFLPLLGQTEGDSHVLRAVSLRSSWTHRRRGHTIDFSILLRASIFRDARRPESLSTSKTVINTGLHTTTTTLHTHFRVSSVGDVRVLGVKGITHEDSTKERAKAIQEEEALEISDAVDRVYLNAQSETFILDEVLLLPCTTHAFPLLYHTCLWPVRTRSLSSF